ncbi:Tryptophan--tRNA ligase, mitochondrial [Dinochytrium kinnereticum]|nr:Tryptophan--tRNA ligase, mitochondrial [Dinochytrium kinnereticum]
MASLTIRPSQLRSRCALLSIPTPHRYTTATTAPLQPPPAPKRTFPRTILSGIQPTGIPHLGNYLGALSNWKKLQDDVADGTGGRHDKVIYSIVDLHAVTVPQDPGNLRRNVVDMAVALLACGIDPGKSVLFRQSKSKMQTLSGSNPPSTSQAQATLSMINSASATPGSDDFTEGEDATGLCLGLLAYPVLQAADILGYGGADWGGSDAAHESDDDDCKEF